MELPKIALALFLALIVCVSAASAACTAGKCTCNCKACQSDSCTCKACTDSCPLTKCSGGSSTSGASCSVSSCSTCKTSSCTTGTCSGAGCTAKKCTIQTFKAVNSPSGAVTYKLCSQNVCIVGGNGKTLTLTNYDTAKNPTYAQLMAFLKADKTDQARYTPDYVCSDFARTLHNNAEKSGIKCAWIACDYTRGIGHAFNRFDTTDKGTVYIDCTGVPRGAVYQDKQLNVKVGSPLTGKFLFRSGYMGSMGTVKKLNVFW